MSLLGEEVVRDAHERLYPATQPTMNYMMDRAPGEYILYGSDKDEDVPFNPLYTCDFDDNKESFCESGKINVMSQIK